MHQKLLRVAVVGCGVGRNHIAQGYHRHPKKFRVRALCDINTARLAAVADEFSIPWCTTSFDELLRLDDIDIVDICTPAALHFSQIPGRTLGRQGGGLREAAGGLARRD